MTDCFCLNSKYFHSAGGQDQREGLIARESQRSALLLQQPGKYNFYRCFFCLLKTFEVEQTRSATLVSVWPDFNTEKVRVTFVDCKDCFTEFIHTSETSNKTLVSNFRH